MLLTEFSLRIAESHQIFLRQIDSAILYIFPDVTNDVCHLQGQPELDCVLFTALVPIAKNLDAYQADSARDSRALNSHLFEGWISSRVQVHFYTGNDFLQHSGRQRVLGDQLSHGASKNRLVLGWGMKHLAPFCKTHSLLHHV